MVIQKDDGEISETCYWMGKPATLEEHQKHRFKQEVVLGIGGGTKIDVAR
jgi:glycerol dehydrogenase-like iron-containing ADH family enzyme